jgi:hypothetical protein
MRQSTSRARVMNSGGGVAWTRPMAKSQRKEVASMTSLFSLILLAIVWKLVPICIRRARVIKSNRIAGALSFQ